MLRMTGVAGILGVTYQRVQQLHKAGRLPQPVRRDEIGPLWKRSDIEKWARAEWWGRRGAGGRLPRTLGRGTGYLGAGTSSFDVSDQ